MSSMRIVLLLLALAAVAFTAKYVLTGSVTGGGGGKVQPAEQLQDVRDRAKELEGELQRASERAEQQTKEPAP